VKAVDLTVTPGGVRSALGLWLRSQDQQLQHHDCLCLLVLLYLIFVWIYG
jgi:hypothetical protein